jgi:predicted transcriptional regulator
MRTTTSVKLDDDVRDRIQRLAAARKRSPQQMMHDAIEQYVDREEQREKTRTDALAAFQQYQKTGQHVGADEADAWLASLEAGDDRAPPACHD